MNTIRLQRHLTQARNATAIAIAGLAVCAHGQGTPLSAAPAAGQTLRVSGMLMTNFIGPTNTLGVATGDLRGAVAAELQEFDMAAGRGVVLHRWVTEAGDQLIFAPLEFKATPAAGDPALGLFHVYYPDAPAIVGGTGRFEGATGRMTSVGAADFVKGQTVFRYSGTLTLKAPALAPTVSGGAVENGRFRFEVQAPGARQVKAEASHNLKDWEPLGTQVPINGTVSFSDPNPASDPARFYRARGE
ncbi:MAG: hypothetical protein JNL97_11240 [Verrucomicrobiales bacterium]|nr:hypothetical protein [Verrucomicrobiales bacterium]